MWTEDTLTVLDQCIQLPGEISTLVLDHVRLACSSRGCAALNQLQRVIRVDGTADSIVELLASGQGSVANQAGVERLYKTEYGGPGTVGAGEVQLEDVQVIGQRRNTLSPSVADHCRQGPKVGGNTNQTIFSFCDYKS